MISIARLLLGIENFSGEKWIIKFIAMIDAA